MSDACFQRAIIAKYRSKCGFATLALIWPLSLWCLKRVECVLNIRPWCGLAGARDSKAGIVMQRMVALTSSVESSPGPCPMPQC